MYYTISVGFEENVMSKIIENVDVIAQFKSDGTIIPLKFRVMNEDGVYESFSVKAYKPALKKGTYTTEDGLYVSGEDLVFICKIMILDAEKTVRLYFLKRSNKWSLGI